MSYPSPTQVTALPQTAPGAQAASAGPAFAGCTTSSFRATPVGRFFTRVFRLCASLQLAISLLSFFAACLALATFLESAYSGQIARDLVYHTWWFALVLVFLAVNILCAALKKFPWKRHQIGFLITHAGLLVLVFGGLMTNLGGVEGKLLMIDSDRGEIQQTLRMSNKADTLQLVDQHQVEVLRVPVDEAKKDEQFLRQIWQAMGDGTEVEEKLRERLGTNYWTLSLRPGSFAWRADEHFRPDLPWGLRLLAGLANPFPGFARALDGNTTFEVKNYYPHTERWPFSPAEKDEDGFPVLRLKLTTPMLPRPVKRWVSSLPSREVDPSPVAFELLVQEDPALLQEFLDPPPASDLGKAGQLAFVVGHQRKLCRVSLDTLTEGRSVELEGTGLKFTLRRRGQLMDLLDEKPEANAEGRPIPLYPAVEFDLSGPGGKGTYVACARLPHFRALREGQDVERFGVWYHYPDFRWGDKHRMGSLQFLKGPGGKVYYRVYGKDGLRQKGRLLDIDDTSAVHELPWKPMAMTFEVLTWLPSAARRDRVVPRHVRPGAEPSERLEPALRCVLKSNGESKEFWVAMSPVAAPVKVGKEIFFVRYRQDTRKLDFSLTLKQARRLTDPGTTRPASFESDVVLAFNKGDEEVRSDHSISMNNTLDHGGYKVYQTEYDAVTDPRTGGPLLDEAGRLVSKSGLTVADDPGLFFKYAGSILLVLGIATMFFMRAYFFKPRGAHTAT
ncbi:MAG: cytochrome c biogenesis protein ResB [Planctomycetes bacterium]|nr:cytochrome c biogenesis protein ResB [Planctomycetota bacterium]